MKNNNLQWVIASILVAYISPSYAGISFGESNSETGQLTVSGYVRGNYQVKDYGENADDQKIRFDAAQLK